MIDINELPNLIFKYLKKAIEENDIYNASVKRHVIDKKYPLVVFNTNQNRLSSQSQDSYRLNIVRNLSFEINIFAVSQANIDSTIICDELANITNMIMQDQFGMQGGIDNKIDNINTDNATEYILRYTCAWDLRHNMIYKQ